MVVDREAGYSTGTAERLLPISASCGTGTTLCSPDHAVARASVPCPGRTLPPGCSCIEVCALAIERHRGGGRLLDRPAARLVYVAGLAARVIAGYKLIALRHRLGFGAPDREAAVRRQHEASARRVLAAVFRLQGLMIKIGQTIGSNPTAIPLEYIAVLSRLQDAVPPRPWSEMRPAIERALGAPIGRVFAEFDPRPVAAASLAQTYRARLPDGRAVAVKALYPGIERLVRSDLRVLKLVLWLDSRVGGYPLEPVYEELAQNVPLEVDLVHEAHAMAAMAEQLGDDPRVVIPKTVWEHTSRRVLVMEWIDGIKITEVERMRTAGIDVQRIADLLLDCYARQMLVEGFFHADPHPGNLFALPGDRIAIVDFGLTKRLTPAFRHSLARLLRAMTTANLPLMVAAFGELGFAVKQGEDHAVFAATGEFFRRISDPRTYGTTPESMLSLNEEWARAVKANPFIAIPGDFTLVSRVFSLLTGVGTAMGAEPHVAQTVLRYTSMEPVVASP